MFYKIIYKGFSYLLVFRIHRSTILQITKIAKKIYIANSEREIVINTWKKEKLLYRIIPSLMH